MSVRDGEFARVPTGESVMLICHLEKKTDCLWTKNDVKQEISSRYSYYDPKDGVQTRDCSLKISAFQADDEGKWQCLNAGTQELVTTLYLNQSKCSSFLFAISIAYI